jgi:hypothetical protein
MKILHLILNPSMFVSIVFVHHLNLHIHLIVENKYRLFELNDVYVHYYYLIH